MITLQKLNFNLNLKYLYNIYKYKLKKIYLYSIYYYVVLFKLELPLTTRVIECSVRLLLAIYSVFVSILCYNNVEITIFIQDLLSKYIIDMGDLFNVNMSPRSSNGVPLPPVGDGGGGMNGLPSPGGNGSDLVLAGAGSRTSDEDINSSFSPLLPNPKSHIIANVEVPYGHERVEWDYIDGKRIEGGFLLSRDGIFIKDYDKYRVPVSYFENRYNFAGDMMGSRRLNHDNGLLLGSNGGYGIGKIIWNDQFYQGFIIPKYPSWDAMTNPGIIIGDDPFKIKANFKFPNFILSPEIENIMNDGRSKYVELGIQYNFFYIGPRNLYICEVTYPEGYKEKITDLKEVSNFMINHRAKMLGCSLNVEKQASILTDPNFTTYDLTNLNNWIRGRLETYKPLPEEVPKYMSLYTDLLEEHPRLRGIFPPSPSPSSSEVEDN